MITDTAAIPHELRETSQWVLWRFEDRDGKPTKVPYAITGTMASSTDPSTWTNFDTALANAEDYSGVGYVFSNSDPFCGIDLDDCFGIAGNLDAKAEKIVGAFSSYTEISPSGHGVKLWIKGKKHVTRCKTAITWSDGIDGEIEIYDQQRYFTVTGQHLDGTPCSIEQRQEQLEELCASVFKKENAEPKPTPGTPPDASDQAIIDKAKSAKNGGTFSMLWDGDTSAYRSPSEADLALCSILAFWVGPDPARIEGLFRQSGLYREKWERDGYRTGTITRAIEDCRECYHWNDDNKAKTSRSRSNTVASTEPLVLAESVLQEYTDDQQCHTIRRWRGDFYTFNHSHYELLSNDEISAALYSHLEQLETPGKNGQLERIAPTKHMVSEVLAALPSRNILIPDLREAPVWLNGKDRPDPINCVACKNGLLDLHARKLHEHTPDYFNLNGLEYAFNPKAPEPQVWLNFLNLLWPGDAASIFTLQRWFGYCLTADTRQQKILMLVGPKRSGKGTIGRVLTAMLGQANVCGATLASLATNFGLSGLLGKLLAIFSDARLSRRTDQAVVVERLLSISGEDGIQIDRKYKDPITAKLPTRLMILTNELPELDDASGAVASRFIVLRLAQSWFGDEDHNLTGKVLAELPGILNWAIEGHTDLAQACRFEQPESAVEAIRQLEDLGSPITAFIRDTCVVGPNREVRMDHLYKAWTAWCKEQGRERTGTQAAFGKDLRTAIPGLRDGRPREGDSRPRIYIGIDLRS